MTNYSIRCSWHSDSMNATVFVWNIPKNLSHTFLPQKSHLSHVTRNTWRVSFGPYANYSTFFVLFRCVLLYFTTVFGTCSTAICRTILIKNVVSYMKIFKESYQCLFLDKFRQDLIITDHPLLLWIWHTVCGLKITMNIHIIQIFWNVEWPNMEAVIPGI